MNNSTTHADESRVAADGKPALKMKIKRKNVAASKNTGSEIKHEIIKDSSSAKSSPENSEGVQTPSALDRLKQALAEKEKERSSGVKAKGGGHRKERSSASKSKESMTGSPGSTGASANSSSSSCEGLTLHIKREPSTSGLDPYEFNAKLEDGPVQVVKKIKIEKVSHHCQPLKIITHTICY